MRLVRRKRRRVRRFWPNLRLRQWAERSSFAPSQPGRRTRPSFSDRLIMLCQFRPRPIEGRPLDVKRIVCEECVAACRVGPAETSGQRFRQEGLLIHLVECNLGKVAQVCAEPRNDVDRKPPQAVNRQCDLLPSLQAATTKLLEKSLVELAGKSATRPAVGVQTLILDGARTSARIRPFGESACRPRC